jgi:hypothetical protein
MHLKLDKPFGLDLIVADTRPKKATTQALNITKTNEIVIKKSKTGKITVVVNKLKFCVVIIAIHGMLVLDKC